MANCKDDFLEAIKGKDVLCAEVTHERDYWDDDRKKIAILPVGYSDVEMQQFLQAINYQYDDGFGGQEVYGTIWYKDGTWSERGEYDGSEWWEYKSCPVVPDALRSGA